MIHKDKLNGGDQQSKRTGQVKTVAFIVDARPLLNRQTDLSICSYSVGGRSSLAKRIADDESAATLSGHALKQWGIPLPGGMI